MSELCNTVGCWRIFGFFCYFNKYIVSNRIWNRLILVIDLELKFLFLKEGIFGCRYILIRIGFNIKVDYLFGWISIGGYRKYVYRIG